MMFTAAGKKMSREMMLKKQINVVAWTKKPRPLKGRGLPSDCGHIFLFVSALGSLDRIDLFLGCRRCSCGQMRRKIAPAGFPFDCRIRTRHTIPGGIELDIAVATIALLHDLMANPAIE
jgi:hypothetical protein